MPDIERILEDAGARWRAGQPAPPLVPATIFRAAGPRAMTPIAPWRLLAAAGIVVILIAAIATFRPGGVLPQGGGAATGTPGGRSGCPVTRPEPAFTAPSPFPSVPPPVYRSAWYGTADLWTMIERDGAVWNGLPHDARGFGQKTYWWTKVFSSTRDETPALRVTGTRLDGAGAFVGGSVTDASADFGTAMLVDVSVPTAGCWQITGSLSGASLSYVVWVSDD